MSAEQTAREADAEPTHGCPRVGRESRGARASIVLVLLGLSSVWCLLMRRLGGADLYSVLGPYALFVIAVLWLLRGRALRSLLRLSLRAVALGVAVGVLMTLGTYLAFDLASAWVPRLDARVEALYRAAHTTAFPLALAWISVIIVAEELLWRGVLLEALERRMPRSAAVFVSVAIYTLAQLGSGSWVVAVAAVVCGSIWTVQRRLTRSLLSPLVSHLIWTPTVVLFCPVTDARSVAPGMPATVEERATADVASSSVGPC